MSKKIDQILQALIPALKQQSLGAIDDFEDFSAWINQSVELLHYIELKEYYDNGIEEDDYFNTLNVNTQQLQAEIEQETSVLFEQFEYKDDMDPEEGFDAQIDIMEQTETIIFDKIKEAASAHHLSLLVIYRENPYWLLVPTTNESELNLIVETFNQTFNQEGDLNMAVYA